SQRGTGAPFQVTSQPAMNRSNGGRTISHSASTAIRVNGFMSLSFTQQRLHRPAERLGEALQDGEGPGFSRLMRFQTDQEFTRPAACCSSIGRARIPLG